MTAKENWMHYFCFEASFAVFNILVVACAEQMAFLICDLRVAFQFHQLSCIFTIIFLSFSAAGSSPGCIGFDCEGKSLTAKDRWVVAS